MNYFLTLQPPTSTMVGILLKTKRCEVLCLYCRHCFRSHVISQNYARGASSYVSALKLKFEKSNTSKKNDGSSLKLRKQTDLHNTTKILKLSPPKDVNRKRFLSKRKLELKGMIGGLGLKNRYGFDSTKSYDPSLISSSLDVENFCKQYGKNKKFTSSFKSDYFRALKKLPNVSDEVFESLDTVSDNSQTRNVIDIRNDFSDISYGNKKTLDIFQPLVLKPTQKQSLKLPDEVVTAEDRKYKHEIDFNKFTTSLTQDHFSLLKSLHSSIDVCILNNMELEAYQLFHMCRKKTKWKSLLSSDKKDVIHVYNTLLHGLSVKGHMSLIRNVLHWMKLDKVSLNGESYAALLLCLCKGINAVNKNFISEETVQIVNELMFKNIPLNDIFSKSRLKKEELDQVLNLVRIAVPNFEIQPVKIDLNSDCNLTKDLHMGHFNLSTHLENFETVQMERLVEEQMQIEKKFHVNVETVSTGPKGSSSEKYIALFDKLKDRWEKSLTDAVSNLQVSLKKNIPKNPDLLNFYVFISCLPKEKFVEILLETTLNLIKYSGGFSPTSGQLCNIIGSSVAQCYYIRKAEITGFSDRTEKLFKNYTSWFLNPQGPARNSRQKWQLLIEECDGNHQLDPQIVKWPGEVRHKVGKCLLDLILNEVKFNAHTKYGEKDFPVLYTVIRYREGRFQEEVKCHPSVSEMIEKIGVKHMCFRADELPMLCPPKPWKSVDHGGYLILSAKFIRPPGGVQGKRLNLRRFPVKKMFATFDSLNALQAVPWKINEGVLDVALELFKNGGSEELKVPKYPDPIEEGTKISGKLSFTEILQDRKRKRELKQQSFNEYGLWCEALYRLSLAQHFRNRIFWMPQNCDFRGRVYPVPPLLNHLGSDLFRSLLMFAKGKPLGPKGLDWLKIHLINLTGSHKKRSVQDRLAYANEIIPEIIDSAENPLTGNKWWVKSDEPWQTLATCMEIKKVLSSPNPEEYVCNLPVHQDGSCNGLQHYAALGKDLTGAKSVNLTSCEVPQDVYIAVANLIEEERVKDAAQGLEIAKVLEGFIQRKVVKQTIMTTVYGVTLYGARLQIEKRLEEIHDFPKEYIKEASLYLSIKTFLCLKKMFTSARQIQEWFTSCAVDICQRGDYVQWMSPLGLPVLQPYAKYRRDSNIVVPDTLKQKNAFPPNFIHSLDSCHMMLTALHCEQAGLTFAAVHDCFWTHPNTVDIMNKICREQFISLHSQTILEDLSDFFVNSYFRNGSSQMNGNIFKAVPKKGSFDVVEVMNSVYFFS